MGTDHLDSPTEPLKISATWEEVAIVREAPTDSAITHEKTVMTDGGIIHSEVYIAKPVTADPGKFRVIAATLVMAPT